MGQYYKPVCLDSEEWMNCYDYDSLAKLMEHSWMRNPLVNAVMRLLAPGGKWHQQRIVWSGDYAEKKRFVHPSTAKAYLNWYKKEYPQYFNSEQEDSGYPNLYDIATDYSEYREHNHRITFKTYPKIKTVPFDDAERQMYPYLVNHDTKQFVDLRKCPFDNDGWQIHPLPILTCDSFGGGGSYHYDNEYNGAWVGHRLSAEMEQPEGFVEIKPDFLEE